MAGALQHIASGNPEKMGSLAYRKGLNAPDYFKRGLIKTEEDFNKYMEGCSPDEMLSYEDFIKVSVSTHFMDNPRHSNSPVLGRFFNSEYVDLSKPFWDAYATHLIGDKVYYMSDEYVNMTKFRNDRERNALIATYALHNDYNFINKMVDDEFGVMQMVSPEIQALGLIKLLEGTPVYQNPNTIIKWINLVRRLTKDMDVKQILGYFNGTISQEHIR